MSAAVWHGQGRHGGGVANQLVTWQGHLSLSRGCPPIAQPLPRREHHRAHDEKPNPTAHFLSMGGHRAVAQGPTSVGPYRAQETCVGTMATGQVA